MPNLNPEKELNKIDRMCIQVGISRRELARRSGVSPRTLEAWAVGLRVPRDVYVLRRIARALGCAIEDLLEDETPEENK